MRIKGRLRKPLLQSNIQHPTSNINFRRVEDLIGSVTRPGEQENACAWDPAFQFQNHGGHHDEVSQALVGGNEECFRRWVPGPQCAEDTNDETLHPIKPVEPRITGIHTDNQALAEGTIIVAISGFLLFRIVAFEFMNASVAWTVPFRFSSKFLQFHIDPVNDITQVCCGNPNQRL